MTEHSGESGLDGKVAIVTGGGTRVVDGLDIVGTGRAAAELFAREGANILVVDRDQDAAERTAKAITAAGGTAEPHVADVTDEDDCQALAARAMSLWGRVDILDNNVGIGSRGAVTVETLEKWERVMRVNVTAMMLTSNLRPTFSAKMPIKPSAKPQL